MTTAVTEIETNADREIPDGMLALQTLAMPKDTNASGDIFGGWLVSQMDLAAGIATKSVAKGRSATVAIEHVSFIAPVVVGSTVSCYTKLIKKGTSSMHFQVQVWMSLLVEGQRKKVADGVFVFVALDDNGKKRAIPE
ncbi:MAG: acyl-CoA thioesterase YciA [Pseudohongiellaceae bacterium]|jgi:acyl-CoA thioesterase YciA